MSRLRHAVLVVALVALAGPTPPSAPAATDGARQWRQLEAGIRGTSAMGLLGKLSFKSEVETLYHDLQALHGGDGRHTLEQLHERYELLVSKLLALVQDGDAALARRVSAVRDELWHHLSDAGRFHALAEASP